MIYTLNETLIAIINLLIIAMGIFMAHSFYKSTRKRWQNILAWALGYLVWGFGANILQLIFPFVPYARFWIFMGITGIFVYQYLFPDISLQQRIFTCFFINTSMNLIAIFSRVLSQRIAQMIGFNLSILFLLIYFSALIGFIVLFRKVLMQLVLTALKAFRKHLTSLSIFAISGYIMLMTLDPWSAWQKIDGWNVITIYSMMLVMVVGYFISFCILSKTMDSETVRADAKMLTAQLDLSERYCTSLTERIKQNNMYIHDLRHHIHALTGLCAEDDLEKVRQYIAEIEHYMPQVEKYRFCTNDVVNALLGYYKALCKEKNIRFDCKVFLPKTKRISSVHLCVIFGNALQNAIEAIELIEEDSKKYLEVMSAISDDKLIITVKNPYFGTIKKDKLGNPISIKTEEGHGYGINSIKESILLYDGWFSFSEIDNVFELRIILKD